MVKQKRSESRTRYYIRSQATQRNWNVLHPSRQGDILEEQEIVDYFPNIGLEQDRPDFLFCLHGEPVLVVEAKNEINKIDIASKEANGIC